MSASAPLTYDEALDLVQQFLGDLGTVVTSEPEEERTTDEFVVVNFHTAADALESKTVVVVDRSTRDCRFLTVQ